MYRDFLPEDLAPHLSTHQLDGSIVVQAAPTYEETDYILSLADQDDTILGVVGYLDLFDPDHRKHYERFRKHPKFVGFRIMIQEMPDANRILEPAFVEALNQYASEDVTVDLLVTCDQLDPLIRLLERVPGLRGVLDHIGKPRIRTGELEPWKSQMEKLAGFSNLACKLSGMVTEADHDHWKPEDFVPYIRHALEQFGPDRVLFGSDWPVCLMAAEYDEVVDVLVKALPEDWGEQERAKLFGLNAREVYRI